MNREQALRAMLDGFTVRAVEPLFLNHQNPPLFRWSREMMEVEWQQCPPDEWKRFNRSFYCLSSEFKIV